MKLETSLTLFASITTITITTISTTTTTSIITTRQYNKYLLISSLLYD